MFQEVSASIGVYLRLAAGAFAVYSAFLLNKGDTRYLKSAKKALLLESLYFALLIPAAINQSVGFFISSGPFLDIKAGVSSLLQALLIFPPLFILSRRLKATPWQHFKCAVGRFCCFNVPVWFMAKTRLHLVNRLFAHHAGGSLGDRWIR